MIVEFFCGLLWKAALLFERLPAGSLAASCQLPGDPSSGFAKVGTVLPEAPVLNLSKSHRAGRIVPALAKNARAGHPLFGCGLASSKAGPPRLDAQTATEKDNEAIVDVNHDGRWIRGLELLGGGDFNLARALKPFHPNRPSEVGRIGVTYDEEANAAFFYFSMKTLPTPPGIATPDFKYSHSITPDARFGFDDDGGLVWVRFRPEEANASAQDFVSLIEAPIEDTELG